MLTDHQVQIIKDQFNKLYSAKSKIYTDRDLFTASEVVKGISRLIDAFEKLNIEEESTNA